MLIDLIIFIGAILILFSSIVTYMWATRSIGYLRIDSSESKTEPYIFLELFKTLDSFRKKKYVVLEIKDENYISHK